MKTTKANFIQTKTRHIFESALSKAFSKISDLDGKNGNEVNFYEAIPTCHGYSKNFRTVDHRISCHIPVKNLADLGKIQLAVAEEDFDWTIDSFPAQEELGLKENWKVVSMVYDFSEDRKTVSVLFSTEAPVRASAATEDVTW